MPKNSIDNRNGNLRENKQASQHDEKNRPKKGVNNIKQAMETAESEWVSLGTIAPPQGRTKRPRTTEPLPPKTELGPMDEGQILRQTIRPQSIQRTKKNVQRRDGSILAYEQISLDLSMAYGKLLELEEAPLPPVSSAPKAKEQPPKARPAAALAAASPAIIEEKPPAEPQPREQAVRPAARQAAPPAETRKKPTMSAEDIMQEVLNNPSAKRAKQAAAIAAAAMEAAKALEPVVPPISAKTEPAKVAPAKAEPAAIAPAKAAPAKAEPAVIAPAKEAPAKAEPAAIAPAKAAPAKAEPAVIAPAKVAPAKAEPAAIAPAKVAPAKAEPAAIAPAKVAPAKAEPAAIAPAKAAPAKQPEKLSQPEKSKKKQADQHSQYGTHETMHMRKTRVKKPQVAAFKRGKAKLHLGQRTYRSLYYIGAQTIRLSRRYQKQGKRFLQSAGRFVAYAWKQYSKKTNKFVENLSRSFYTPFKELQQHYISFRENVREARPKGLKHTMKTIFGTANYLLRSGKKAFGIIFSYVAPVVGIIILVNTINYFNSLTLALQVEYSGETIGYISNEAAFTNAESTMQQRIITDDTAQAANITPMFSLIVADENQLTDEETLTNRLISASGTNVEEADGVYISDRFLGAIKNGEEFLMYLESVLEGYKTDADNERITFIKSIKVKRSLYPASSLIDLQGMINLVNSDEEVQREYTIEAGDTPSGVASKNNIPYSTLQTLNPDMSKNFLPGKTLTISQAVPYLGVKLTRTEVYDQDVAFTTDITYDDRYPKGYSVVTKAGRKGAEEVVADVTYIDGVEIERNVRSTTIVSEPIPQKVTQGTLTPQQYANNTVGGSGFMWPVDGGGYVSCHINGYWGHTGMDIAGRPIGTGIRAAASGRVTLARGYGAYGNHVIIQHPSGVQTLYAHMNSLNVSVGQTVEQGQLIGTLGRTGNVTGPHLHFEVRVNGRYMNPALYIGSR